MITVIGMYHKVSPTNEITVEKSEKIKDLCDRQQFEFNKVYNVKSE